MATDVIATARKAVNAPVGALDALGEQLSFYLRALAWTPRTIRRYKKEVLRLLSEVVSGSGSLAVIGGTVGVITVLCFFTGTEVGLQGYAALDQLGIGSYSGFFSACLHTRETAPPGPRAARPPPSAAASPPSSAPCGSARRSTRSRSWRCPACRSS